jgi:hypothetical protein
MILVRRLAGLAACYAVTLTGGFLLYLALVASPVLAGIPLLFYRGIAIAFLCIPLMGLAAALLNRRLGGPDLPTAIGAIALSLAFNISFLITFPVTFDRSITMFLLARIERQDGQLDGRALEQVYVREYLGQMGQIDRRIAEQDVSGNIRVRHGHIWITPQGRRLLIGARAVGHWFGADPRFVSAPDIRAGTGRH